MLPSLKDVVISLMSTGGCLLRPQDVEDEGTIEISSRSGAHLTAEAILNGQKRRDERRHPPARWQREAEDEQLLRDYKMDSAGDIRRLVVLKPAREGRRARIEHSQEVHRFCARARARAGAFQMSHRDD